MSCDIDLATGEVTHERIDIDLPSLIPISFGRLYVSTSSARSVLGPAWSHNWQRWARFAPEGLLIHDGYDEDRVSPLDQCNGEDGPNILREDRSLRLSFPDGSRQDYYAFGDLDAQWWLVQLVDVDGNYVQIHYDHENIARLTSSEGHRLVFRYERGLLRSIDIDPHPSHIEGPLVAYQHDEAGQLVAVRDARGFIERYEYDDNLLVTYENRTGGRTHYAYDAERRCAVTWQANGKLFRRFEFDVLRHNTLVSTAAEDALSTVSTKQAASSNRIQCNRRGDLRDVYGRRRNRLHDGPSRNALRSGALQRRINGNSSRSNPAARPSSRDSTNTSGSFRPDTCPLVSSTTTTMTKDGWPPMRYPDGSLC